MKVLLGVATYPPSSGMPAIFPAAKAALDALEWDGELVIVEYGDDDPTATTAVDDLLIKHSLMRQDALTSEVDALLTVEADMIVPTDTLTKLSALDADVACGLYVSRSSRIWLCFPQIDGYHAVALNADPDAARAVWGRVVTSEGAGFGCTLIHRNVLEAIEFRGDPRKRFADDWQFAIDCKEQGFRMMHDLSVICGHIIHEGGVLWPDIEAPLLHRVEGYATPQHNGLALPDRATYRVLKAISGKREYRLNDEIELSAADAAIFLERRAIQVKEN